MKAKLRADEQLIKEGSANLQKGIETVGGNLCLTNQRLIFEAAKGNVQGGVTEFELSTIQATQPCWTKFLGFIPAWPLTSASASVCTSSSTTNRLAMANCLTMNAMDTYSFQNEAAV